jgi:hypothetical protein
MKRIVCLLFALILWGCSSQKEAEKSNRLSEYTEELRKYEASFHPSDYDEDVDVVMKESNKRAEKSSEGATDAITTKTRELVSGFRVQLFSTSSIDDANAEKAAAEALFPGERFYLVYDPPTYKIRGGNFLNRFDADKFAQQLADKGYRDAWIVPDRVYKNVSRPAPTIEDQPTQK